jgi:alpha/beta superfamily hydrolase
MSRTMTAVAPMTFIVGLSIGAAVATLLLQEPMERRGGLVKAAQTQTDEALRIADKNLQTANGCMETLRRIAGIKQ